MINITPFNTISHSKMIVSEVLEKIIYLMEVR